MNFIIVDDESSVLSEIDELLKQIAPLCETHLFSAPDQALDYAKQAAIDVAFLDIVMRSMNGIDLARELKKVREELHIIFVTGHKGFAFEAFSIHASGYLVKPITADDISQELAFLYGEALMAVRKIRIQTFGGFSVFVNDKPLKFNRAKSKELLACLVDHRGAALTTREVCNLLWEDGAYSRSRKNYFQVVLADLRVTLRQAGIGDILVRHRNSLSIAPGSFDCDSYRLLDGEAQAVNSYRHNYLPSYSWAEFTVGTLEKDLHL